MKIVSFNCNDDGIASQRYRLYIDGKEYSIIKHRKFYNGYYELYIDGGVQFSSDMDTLLNVIGTSYDEISKLYPEELI
jgi:hypothetical protein